TSSLAIAASPGVRSVVEGGRSVDGLEAEADGLGARAVGADGLGRQLHLHPELHVLGVGRDVHEVAAHARPVAVDDRGHERDRDARGRERHDRERAHLPRVRDADLAELRAAAARAGVAPVEEPRTAVGALVRDEVRVVPEHQVVDERDLRRHADLLGAGPPTVLRAPIGTPAGQRCGTDVRIPYVSAASSGVGTLPRAHERGVAMLTSRPEWDDVVDVVVLGSGAAALVAATLAHDGGASVAVLEKADLIGGTTGVSGGMPWIPMNRHMAEVGVDDSRDEALAYIRRLTLGREPDPALLETYVDTAPEMLDYLEAKTPLRMTAPTTFNDYYAHLPGGKLAGRSIEPAPFDARELGDWAPRLRTSPHLPWLTMEEGARFLRGEAMPDIELAGRRQAEDVRVLGAALVAALFKGLLDRGVEVRTAAAASDLVVEDGTVIGVQSAVGAIGARRGVVLACGGFEWNPEMVRGFIGEPIEPMSPPHNE